MTMSLQQSPLSRPVDGASVPEETLGYVHGRSRSNAANMLLKAFRESGLTKVEVASRLGKKPEQITRWLGSANNLTIDTISSLLFAINGNGVGFHEDDFLSAAVRNQQGPAWFTEPRTEFDRSIFEVRTETTSSNSPSTHFAKFGNSQNVG